MNKDNYCGVWTPPFSCTYLPTVVQVSDFAVVYKVQTSMQTDRQTDETLEKPYKRHF